MIVPFVVKCPRSKPKHLSACNLPYISSCFFDTNGKFKRCPGKRRRKKGKRNSGKRELFPKKRKYRVMKCLKNRWIYNCNKLHCRDDPNCEYGKKKVFKAPT